MTRYDTLAVGSNPTAGTTFPLKNQWLNFFNVENNAKGIKLAVGNRKPPL